MSVAALVAILELLDHRKGLDSVVSRISNAQDIVLAAADASWIVELSDSCTLACRPSAKHGHKQAGVGLEHLDSVVVLVSDVDQSVAAQAHTGWVLELTILCSFAAKLSHVRVCVLSKHLHAVIATLSNVQQSVCGATHTCRTGKLSVPVPACA